MWTLFSELLFGSEALFALVLVQCGGLFYCEARHHYSYFKISQTLLSSGLYHCGERERAHCFRFLRVDKSVHRMSFSLYVRNGSSQTLDRSPRPFLITLTDYEKTEFCNPKNEKINPYDARITEIIFVIVFSWSSITEMGSILRDRSRDRLRRVHSS